MSLSNQKPDYPEQSKCLTCGHTRCWLAYGLPRTEEQILWNRRNNAEPCEACGSKDISNVEVDATVDAVAAILRRAL